MASQQSASTAQQSKKTIVAERTGDRDIGAFTSIAPETIWRQLSTALTIHPAAPRRLSRRMGRSHGKRGFCFVTEIAEAPRHVSGHAATYLIPLGPLYPLPASDLAASNNAWCHYIFTLAAEYEFARYTTH
jgi:hypothetical protein